MTGQPRQLRKPSLFAALAVAVTCFDPSARAEPSTPQRLAFPESQLEPLHWAALEGWAEDDHAAAFAAFQASCKPLVARLKWGNAKQAKKARRAADERPMRVALTEVCVRAVEADVADGAAARAFFEENFRPVQIGKLGEETGLLTGYYEPIIEGSRFPSHEYTVPVYGKPSNLVAARRARAEGAFPNKGRVGRRVGRKKLVPYHDRAEIEDGVLAGRDLEICWVKDPIDAFFMQIQGSARIKLDTGKMLRLNYAAHNGHPYTPVGRLLIERKEVSKEEMSMDRIREWMQKNPDAGQALRRENRSYVFMRETGLADDAEPTGAQGISLTPGRSIAVDSKLHVYGTPFFISAALPIESERPVTPFRRLMVAQDTGSAIVGPARADIYFGAGEEPGRIAGRIKQQGRFVMLVPRALDPVRTAEAVPVPAPRPPQPDDPPRAAPEPPAPALAYAAPPAAAVARPPLTAIPPIRPGATPAESVKAATPIPLPRPAREAPPRMAAPARPPDWLASVAPLSREAAALVSARTAPSSYDAAAADIAAAAAAPAAFAAPAVAHAAELLFEPAVLAWDVPMPRPRPQARTFARR